jgi:hypothetical protein
MNVLSMLLSQFCEVSLYLDFLISKSVICKIIYSINHELKKLPSWRQTPGTKHFIHIRILRRQTHHQCPIRSSHLPSWMCLTSRLWFLRCQRRPRVQTFQIHFQIIWKSSSQSRSSQTKFQKYQPKYAHLTQIND